MRKEDKSKLDEIAKMILFKEAVVKKTTAEIEEKVVREVKQLKVILDKDYAEEVIPWMQRVFHRNSYSDLFQLALGVLAFHADVLSKNHRVVEVDETGNALGYVAFPEFEAISSSRQRIQAGRKNTEEVMAGARRGIDP